MITYIVEFFILHTLFFGIYKLLLAKETQLGFLRFFLIGSTVLALLIPQIKIPAASPIMTVDLGSTIYPAIQAQSIQVSETESYLNWVEILLILISATFLIKLAIGIHTIFQLEERSKVKKINGIYVREVSDIKTSFTFMRWIFIDPEYFENSKDIIQHELGHAKKLHTIDILFFNLLLVIFWWVPTLWLMLKELKTVHEYEADAFALKTNDQTYTKTLVVSTLGAQGLNLASSFHDAPIFNRLKFIRQMKRKIRTWKLASILAIVGTSAAMFACEDELNSEIKRIAEASNQAIEYSDDIKAALNQLKKENPGVTYVVVETSLDNEEHIEKLNAYDPGQIAKIFVNSDGDHKTVTMIVSQDSDLYSKTIEIQDTTDEVFTITDKVASFPGGIEAFYEYMSENLTFPEEAQKAKAEGRVFVQFIVEVDGSITNARVVKGIHSSCDAEALRVVKNSPKWNPGEVNGKPVRQKLIQNVLFKLPG